MVSSIVINQIKKKIQKGCGFKLDNCVFEIYYKENIFRLIANGLNNENFTTDRPVTEFSDLSDILLAKVKDSIEAKQIDRLDLFLNFKKGSSRCDVYYINQLNKKTKTPLNEVI